MLRFKGVLNAAGNKQYMQAMDIVKETQEHGNHVTNLLSQADVLQLAGYTAVEYCGGPAMNFRMGRKDIEQEGESKDLVLNLKSQNSSGQELVTKINQMDLTPAEKVALMGSFTLGFANDQEDTKKNRWVMNPYVFDNTYFKEVLLGSKSIYLKTQDDLALLENPATKEWVEAYAQDQALFFENYAKAHVKVSELGYEEGELLSEINEADMVNGGYQEFGGAHWTKKFSFFTNVET